MKNLLPHFILENYKNNIFEGKLKAFAIFADISGFTPMTEQFMKEGNEGAEILSEILKKIFKPTVKCVYDSGGFITNFAGDSFTTLIPVSNAANISNGHSLNALHCANNILSEFKNFLSYKTKFGAVNLKVRIGMSIGKVEWAIVGKEHKSFYFRGDAINECAEAQKETLENEILFHDNIYKYFKSHKLSFSRKGKYYFLKYFPDGFKASAPQFKQDISNLTKQIFSKHFFPETVFSAKESGEFRDVAPVFISFNSGLSKATLDKLSNTIVNAAVHYSGYVKDIAFGDKGAVIVTFFGAPVSNEEDIQRAMSFVKLTKEKLNDENNSKDLKLKIGITSGKAYTGFIGSDERIQYSVMGNVVNLCARFMAKAGPDEVWISEDAYHRIKNKSDFVSIGHHQFKGFNTEIPVYKFIGKSLPGNNKRSIVNLKPADQHHLLSGAMIGRAGEIEKLKTYTAGIFENNSSGIIYVTGEAGIGKSKLVKEFRKEFGRSNKVTWLYCYASEILNRPLLPFKYLLKNFFKQSSFNTAEENKKVFENIIDIILKRLENLSIENKARGSEYLQIKNEIVRTNSILAAMIDIYWENSLYEQLEPELRFENTIFAICNFVMAECMLQPVVLEIEDVHWLDNDSWEVLKMLLNNITNLPLTIICTSRYLLPRKKLLADNNRVRHDILLDYLNKDDIRNFAKEILKDDIDDDAVNFILQNTNGNPYFIEQLILDFKEREIWKKKNNTFSLSKYYEQNIPSTINSVLISRFDRLPGNVKNIVQTASILGREFEFRVLRQMFPEDNELESKISTAEHEKIWYPANEGKFVFTHALLNKAVYEMQMKSEVNDLHLKAAESIKKLYGKKISHHNSEQIAYHLGLGHNIVNNKNKVILAKDKLKDQDYKENVIEYLKLQTSIADKYKTDYRNEKALELYDLILTLLEKLNDKEKAYYLLLKKAEVLNSISRWEYAKKEAEKASKIAEELKDKYKEMVGKMILAETYFYMNDYSKSLTFYNKILKYFKSTKRFNEIIYILDFFGKIFLSRGNYNKALQIFKYQLKLSNRLNNRKQRALSYYNLGMINRRQGEFGKALEYFRISLKYFKESNNKPKIASVFRLIGVINFNKGDTEIALKYFQTAKKIFEELGDRNNYAITLGNIGNIYLIMHEYEKAKIYFEEQLEINKQLNNVLNLSLSYLNMAALYMETSKYIDALKFFLEQKRVLSKYRKLDSLPMILSNIGAIYSYQGNIKKALEAYTNQFRIDKQLNNKDGILRALINIASLYDMTGDYKRSLSYYKKVIALSSKFKIKIHIPIILFNISSVLLKLNRFKLADYYCYKLLKSKFLLKKELFLDESLFLKDNIFMQKNIFLKGKLPVSGHNLRKLFKNMQSHLSKFKNKESIAGGHFDLFVIAESLNKMNIKTPGMDFHRHSAIKLYNELKDSISPIDYKIKMERLSLENN